MKQRKLIIKEITLSQGAQDFLFHCKNIPTQAISEKAMLALNHDSFFTLECKKQFYLVLKSVLMTIFWPFMMLKESFKQSNMLHLFEMSKRTCQGDLLFGYTDCYNKELSQAIFQDSPFYVNRLWGYPENLPYCCFLGLFWGTIKDLPQNWEMGIEVVGKNEW